MKIKDVYILKEAVDDLNEGRSFYDLQKPGVQRPGVGPREVVEIEQIIADFGL